LGEKLKMPGQKVSAMRRLMIALLVAATVSFTLPSALAQDQINLGKETTGTFAFVADGGGNFTLNLCDNLNGSRKCVSGDTVIGTATGTGDFLGYNGVYILQGNATQTGTFTGCVGTTCTWTISGGGLNFEFSPTKSGATDWLSGTLTMTGLTEVPSGKVFEETISITLSNLGGILAGDFQTKNGVVVFNVQTQSTQNLATARSGSGIQGILENGDVSTTPEPATMTLLGSGSLLVGGFLRFLRKKFTA
jgi:PEP-CTERM motif